MPSSSKRFSLLNMVRTPVPEYHCEQCQVTVHEIGQWLPHLGHDTATDALVLEQMDPWVNEHPTPEDDPEHESYFDGTLEYSSPGVVVRRPRSSSFMSKLMKRKSAEYS